MHKVIALLIAALSIGACSGGSTPPATACNNGAEPSYLYRSGITHLEIYKPATCSYEPLFIKGVNLGVATPGKYAGDLETAASKADFLRWFQLMSDAGINVVRVYTLHMDFFYDALLEFNTAREASGLTPLYLTQGIWLDETSPAVDLYSVTTEFTTNINEVVHAVHGNTNLDYVGRPGKGYGTYTSDVSKWVLAWIVGREVHPDEVELTNDAHLLITSYTGSNLSLPAGSATEAWITARMDDVLSLEKSSYAVTRPISFSSWPTLDPLTHSTEQGSPVWEDYQQVDLKNIDTGNAPAGVFYSFHAYPYYPDFISEDPLYRTYTDTDSTPNSYRGYLNALKNHYTGRPVIIAEFSVPSSWGSVHTAHSGMHHGGHDETTQGLYGARMLQNIHDANMGGGMVFAWIDEWWKPTWLTNEFDFSTQRDGSNNLINRRAYWHNIMAPEQNYGLLAFTPDAPSYSTLLQSDNSSAWAGTNITTVGSAADTTYYHLKLGLNTALTNSDELLIALDTYDNSLGEDTLSTSSTNPGNQISVDITPLNNRSEFLLHLYHNGTNWQAQLYVSSDYDLYGLYGDPPISNLQSPATPTDLWNKVKWKTNYTVYSGVDRDNVAYTSFYNVAANTEFNAGALRVRDIGSAANSKDAIMLYSDRIEIRLPWSLLQFSDPSQLQVFHDDTGIPDTQDSLTTTGVAQAIVFNGVLEGETNRYLWSTWFTDPNDSYLPFADQLEPIPTYTETLKNSYTIYKNAIVDIGN